MPLELTPGTTVPIPCRACGEACMPFKLEEGRHPLSCPRCGSATIATVSIDEEGLWRVRTEAKWVKAPAASRR